MSKDIGWTMLKKTSEYNFLKWGQYMKRANIAERKVEKLKALILYTDPILSSEECGSEIQLKQWSEFVKTFPDEGELNQRN